MPAGPVWDTPDTMFSDPENPHLGGYILGGDPWSWYPLMWRWLLSSCEIRSVIDVGCGEGHAIRWFESQGCEVLGVEGVPQTDPRIIQHDYTTGPYVPDQRFDLCWSCEFVEHVAEKHIQNFLTTFAAADMVLMTHAVPGQGGHHHVNCQEADYWQDKMADIGFKFNESLTSASRTLAQDGYYAWTGLAFVR